MVASTITNALGQPTVGRRHAAGFWAVAFAFLIAGLVGVISDHLALRPLSPYGALTVAIASIALNLVLENVVRFLFGNAPRNFDLPVVRDWIFGPIRVGCGYPSRFRAHGRPGVLGTGGCGSGPRSVAIRSEQPGMAEAG